MRRLRDAHEIERAELEAKEFYDEGIQYEARHQGQIYWFSCPLLLNETVVFLNQDQKNGW